MNLWLYQNKIFFTDFFGKRTECGEYIFNGLSVDSFAIKEPDKDNKNIISGYYLILNKQNFREFDDFVRLEVLHKDIVRFREIFIYKSMLDNNNLIELVKANNSDVVIFKIAKKLKDKSYLLSKCKNRSKNKQNKSHKISDEIPL